MVSTIGAQTPAPQSASARRGEATLPPADSVLQHIYDEGMHHSHAEALAQTLMDSIGPRLTGSPANLAANDWLLRTYTAWDVPVHNEPYGTWRSWTRGPTHLDLVAPRVRTLEATALGWSPATPAGGITGDVVALPPVNQTHDSLGFARWLTTVRGKFVLFSPPPVSCRPDTSWATFALPAAKSAMHAARDSVTPESSTRSPNCAEPTTPTNTSCSPPMSIPGTPARARPTTVPAPS